jgi:hypothetical protein
MMPPSSLTGRKRHAAEPTFGHEDGAFEGTSRSRHDHELVTHHLEQGVSSQARPLLDSAPREEAAMTAKRSFRVFAPVGDLVLAFQGRQEAARAREALLTGGYDDEDVMQFSSVAVEAVPMRAGVSRRVS